MFTVIAWCSTRSKMAVAMTRSPNTSPQAPKDWLLVRIMGPRSYRLYPDTPDQRRWPCGCNDATVCATEQTAKWRAGRWKRNNHLSGLAKVGLVGGGCVRRTRAFFF